MFPEAVGEAAAGLLDDTILTGKRKRKMLHGSYQMLLQVDRNRTGKRQRSESPGVVDEDDEYAQDDSQLQSDDSSVVSDAEPKDAKKKKPASEVCKRPSLIPHGLQALFEASLCRFGYGRWRDIRTNMEQRAREEIATAVAHADKQPALGMMQVQETSRIAALVDRVSVDDIRAYAVGWLKMCYLCTKHKALYASDSEGDSDDDRVVKKKRKRSFKSDGLETELHDSSQLADDARQLIAEERARRKQEKRQKEKQNALAAIEAVNQTMADIVRSKSPSPQPPITQPAAVKVEAIKVKAAVKAEGPAPTVQPGGVLLTVPDATIKAEHSNGVKHENGLVKAEEKKEEKQAEEDEEGGGGGRGSWMGSTSCSCSISFPSTPHCSLLTSRSISSCVARTCSPCCSWCTHSTRTSCWRSLCSPAIRLTAPPACTVSFTSVRIRRAVCSGCTTT